MAVTFELVVDFEGFAEAMAERFDEVRAGVGRGLRELQRELLGEIRRNLRGTSIFGLGDNQASAWRERTPVTRDGDRLYVVLGSTHPLARLREEGGTIRPGRTAARAGPRRGQRTRALIIPLEAAKTKITRVARAGRVATQGATEQFGPLKAILWRPRGRRIMGKLVEGVRRQSKRGPAREIIAAKPGGRSYFLLAKYVDMPSRPYLRPALAAVGSRSGKIMREAIEKELGK